MRLSFSSEKSERPWQSAELDRDFMFLKKKNTLRTKKKDNMVQSQFRFSIILHFFYWHFFRLKKNERNNEIKRAIVRMNEQIRRKKKVNEGASAMHTMKE